VLTGLSAHTIDNTIAISLVVLCAFLIEKHVTLDSSGAPDDSFSSEKTELEQLCNDSVIAWQALGTENYERKKSDKGNLVFRRPLYVVRILQKGEKFTSDNVRSIRPGYGLTPEILYSILGKPSGKDSK